MSDNNTIKQLRNEVQLLRDEIAIMKRKYEDIIYNLDDDNFSSRFVKEKGEMRTAIEVNAEGIKTKVSNEEFESTKTQTAKLIASEVKALSDADEAMSKELSTKITQTANEIRSEVQSAVADVNADTDEKLKDYSTKTQTAEKIESTVTKQYVTNLIGGDYVTDATLTSKLEQSANGIYSTVSETYETKNDANSSYNSLSGYISNVSQEAGRIESRVEELETFKSSTFTQTADGFTLDGWQTTFTGVVFLTDNSGNKQVGLFHDESQDFAQVLLGKYSDDYCPLIIGFNDDDVYIGDRTSGNEVATRSWVRENAGSGGTGGTATAVFG